MLGLGLGLREALGHAAKRVGLAEHLLGEAEVYISLTSPLHLPYISPISPLHLLGEAEVDEPQVAARVDELVRFRGRGIS